MINELKILFGNIRNFRLKPLITEAVGDDVITNAINSHEIIHLYYDGDENTAKGDRYVRPYVLGSNKNGRVLRAWEDRGASMSYSLAHRGEEHDFWYDNDGKIKPGWRMFRLDKVSHVYPTGRKFNNPDGTVMIPPKYNEGADKDMTGIIAYVSSKREPTFVPRTPVERPEKGRYKRFVNANAANRRIAADDVVKLYDIAKRVYHKASNRYIVAINDNNEYELIDVNQKNLIPKQAIVGTLPNLYDTLVNTKPIDKNIIDKRLNQVKSELKENELPTIPFERKPFFKT